MIIIATRQLINKNKAFKHNIVADINNLPSLQKTLSKTTDKEQLIKIYDLGQAQNTPNHITEIKDHINKTGINPIIKNTQIKKITFRVRGQDRQIWNDKLEFYRMSMGFGGFTLHFGCERA